MNAPYAPILALAAAFGLAFIARDLHRPRPARNAWRQRPERGWDGQGPI